MSTSTRPPSEHVAEPIDGAAERTARRSVVLPVAWRGLLVAASAGVVWLPSSLPDAAWWPLFAFALATILWVTTSWNAAYVGVLAVLVAVLPTGGQHQLFDALADDVIWLMIGAFVLGGALRESGLADRLTATVLGRARTVGGVCWLLATVVIPLSFVVPSTSGRAAVMLPVFRTVTETVADRKVTRALGLLVPTVILVSTICTLIGAASHLITVDLLERVAGDSISFTQWMVWGLPFGVAAGYLATWVITRMFLDAPRRRRVVTMPTASRGRASRDEKVTLAVAGLAIALWLTESVHGLRIATVTVLAALVLTMPGFGVLSWRRGMAAVSWNLVVFVGAATALGQALVDSGGARWIVQRLFAISGIAETSSTLVALVLLAVLSLTAHLYVTSHTVRAVVLVPPLLYLASTLDLDAVAVVFIATVGLNFCLSLPVSSKALLMFSESDGGATFTVRDLMRLSIVLAAVHLVLIVAFYYGYWQWTGLAL